MKIFLQYLKYSFLLHIFSQRVLCMYVILYLCTFETMYDKLVEVIPNLLTVLNSLGLSDNLLITLVSNKKGA